MPEAGITLLAAEEGGGTSNFLIPNGTFFFVLAIFLIVLGVIGKFVVPPVQKVLSERERMIAKTAEDNRTATEQEAAANADYNSELAAGRAEAAAIRDQARTEGRAVVDAKRGVAAEEVADNVSRVNEELKLNSEAISGELRSSVETLSATLASRVLGVDVSGAQVAGR